MIICDSYKFIFIHIPRTGGTSLTDMFCRQLPGIHRAGLQHASAQANQTDIYARPDYRIFAFTRNPWARLYSWYQLLRKYNPHQIFTLESFLLDYDATMTRLGHDGSFYFNQLDYLRNQQDELVTDFLGRYESYHHDVNTLMEKLNIPAMQVPHLNSTQGPDYRRQYTTAARELIAERCAQDIAYFGYTFDP